MKNLFQALVILLLFTSCNQENFEDFNKKSFLEKNYLINFSKEKVSEELLEKFDIVMEGLVKSSNQDIDDNLLSYSKYLNERKVHLTEDFQASFKTNQNIPDLENYSNEFNVFVENFMIVLNIIENPSEYVEIIESEIDLNLISNMNERQIAYDLIFITDILIQYKLSFSDNSSMRVKINTQCLGTIGLGILTGCAYGPYGCVFGLGFGALAC